jgi:hypothetical protein
VTWSACTWVFIAYTSFKPNSLIRLRSLSTVLSTGSINWTWRIKQIRWEHGIDQMYVFIYQPRTERYYSSKLSQWLLLV